MRCVWNQHHSEGSGRSMLTGPLFDGSKRRPHPAVRRLAVDATPGGEPDALAGDTTRGGCPRWTSLDVPSDNCAIVPNDYTSQSAGLATTHIVRAAGARRTWRTWLELRILRVTAYERRMDSAVEDDHAIVYVHTTTTPRRVLTSSIHQIRPSTRSPSYPPITPRRTPHVVRLRCAATASPVLRCRRRCRCCRRRRRLNSDDVPILSSVGIRIASAEPPSSILVSGAPNLLLLLLLLLLFYCSPGADSRQLRRRRRRRQPSKKCRHGDSFRLTAGGRSPAALSANQIAAACARSLLISRDSGDTWRPVGEKNDDDALFDFKKNFNGTASTYTMKGQWNIDWIFFCLRVARILFLKK